MLTREDAQRIAAATRCLRPAWSHEALMTLMGDERIRAHRQPRHVAAALAYLALDATTRESTRILAGGPWWGTANAPGEHNASAGIRRTSSDDCDICHQPAERHVVASLNDHEYRPRNASGPGIHAPSGLTRTTTQEEHR